MKIKVIQYPYPTHDENIKIARLVCHFFTVLVVLEEALTFWTGTWTVFSGGTCENRCGRGERSFSWCESHASITFKNKFDSNVNKSTSDL